MAEKTAPNLGTKYGYSTGESGWGGGYNTNMLRFDTVTQLSVLSASTTAPPGTPADGDRYIVGASAAGAWTSHDGEVALWLADDSAWHFYPAEAGWRAWVADVERFVVWDGSRWAPERGAERQRIVAVGGPTNLTFDDHNGCVLVLGTGASLAVDWADVGSGFRCTVLNRTGAALTPTVSNFTAGTITNAAGHTKLGSDGMVDLLAFSPDGGTTKVLQAVGDTAA